MTLTVAFDYGSRAEIVDAARRAKTLSRPVTTDDLSSAMYLPDMPPVDVVVRTSGERRVSNFLLWQAAGAPIYFSDKTWPDFSADDIDGALTLARGHQRS